MVALVVAGLGAVANTRAANVGWDYSPARLGRMLDDGSWIHPLRLGAVNGSPEFSFPVDIVYRNTHGPSMLFGSEWFCPQLESRLVPKGEDYYLWTTPWGSALALERSRNGDYRDSEGRWVAKGDARRPSVRDRDGWIYQYENGRLDWVKSPTGRQLQFVYQKDALRSLEIQDPGSATRRVLLQVVWGAGPLADRVVELDVDGVHHKLGYSPGEDPRLESWIAPPNRPTRFRYDKNNCLAQVDPPSGKPDRFTFRFEAPPGDRTRSAKLPSNYRLLAANAEKYEFALDGKPGRPDFTITLRGTLPDGGLAERIFAPGRGTVTNVSSDGKREELSYHLAPGQPFNGKLRRVTRDGRVLLEHRYDPRSGLLKETLSADGMLTCYEYAKDARAQAREGPDPAPIRLTRGPSAKQQRVLGIYQYDAAGRLTASQDAAGNVSRFGYSQRGDLVAMTDAAGVRYSFGFDPLGRVTFTAVGDRKQSVVYGADGRIASRTDPAGVQTAYRYNEQGQVTQVEVEGQTVATLERNSSGDVIGQIDGLGRQTRVARDPQGRVLGVVDAGKRMTRYAYDKEGRIASQTDASGNVVRFEHDKKGRLVKQSNDLGQVFAWTYDAEDRLIERTNGVQKIRYAYDRNQKPTLITYEDVQGGAVQYAGFEYDDHGRVRVAWNDDAKATHFYNERGMLVAKRLEAEGKTYALRYDYDPAGRRTSLTLSEAVPGKDYLLLHQIGSAYAPDGTLAELKANGRPICRYTRDSLSGMLKRAVYGNGITAGYGYDRLGRLAWVKAEAGPLVQPLLLAYEWDAASQVARRHWGGAVQSYEYDDMGQLAAVWEETAGAAKAPGRQPETGGRALLECYRYDLAGNLYWKSERGEARSLCFDKANQVTRLVTPHADSVFTYDLAGRLTEETVTPLHPAAAELARTGRRIRYGYLDKPLEITLQDGSRIRYAYWPDGQVASKRRIGPDGKSGEPEISLWDGLALLRRGDMSFVSEPHLSGGAIVAGFQSPTAVPTYFLNDLLSTTLAVVHPDRLEVVPLTAFGRPVARGADPEPPPGPGSPAPLPPARSPLSTSATSAAPGLQLGSITPTRMQEESEP